MRVSIFLPVSRERRLEKMIRTVADLEVGNNTILNVVIVIDNNRITSKILGDILRRVTVKNQIGKEVPISDIYSFVDVYTKLPPSPAIGIPQRRKRISKVFQLGARYIDPSADLVFVVEDDSDIESNAMRGLIDSYEALHNQGMRVGLVSGVQVGRWGGRVIGAWAANDPSDPQYIQTVPFTRKTLISEIHAAGFYCFVTKRKLFVRSSFKTEDFGPDVHYGLSLVPKYRNFLDWQIIAEHATPSGNLIPDEKCEVVAYKKNKDGKWKQTKPVFVKI